MTVFADVDKEAKTLKCKNAPPNATKSIHSCSAWDVPTIETEPLKPCKRTVLEPLKIPSPNNLACDKPNSVYCSKQPSWQAGGVVDFAKSQSMHERYDAPVLLGSMDIL